MLKVDESGVSFTGNIAEIVVDLGAAVAAAHGLFESEFDTKTADTLIVCSGRLGIITDENPESTLPVAEEVAKAIADFIKRGGKINE